MTKNVTPNVTPKQKPQIAQKLSSKDLPQNGDKSTEKVGKYWLFKAGGSNNPNGKSQQPKDSSITRWFRQKFEKHPNVKARLAKAILNKALKGDTSTQRLIWSYMDGVPQQQSNNNDGSKLLVILPPKTKTKILAGEEIPIAPKTYLEQQNTPTFQEEKEQLLTKAIQSARKRKVY